MANGHGPGIKFNGKLVGITPEGVVSFRPDVGDIQRIVKYFTKYPTANFDVTATLVGTAGGVGNVDKAPESGG